MVSKVKKYNELCNYTIFFRKTLTKWELRLIIFKILIINEQLLIKLIIFYFNVMSLKSIGNGICNPYYYHGVIYIFCLYFIYQELTGL